MDLLESILLTFPIIKPVEEKIQYLRKIKRRNSFKFERQIEIFILFCVIKELKPELE